MATYAHLKPIEGTEDFLVENVIVAETFFVEGKPEYILLEKGVYAGIGFTYSAGVFTTPPEDSESEE